jgi:hypothetical protein
MPAKGIPFQKPKCVSTPTQIAKVFRSHFLEIPATVFAFKEDDFNVLDQNMDFFKDLWTVDSYVSEKVLGEALKKAFPAVKAQTARLISKDIKSNLTMIQYKKRKITSGLKLPVLKKFLEMVDTDSDDNLPIEQKHQSPASSSKLAKASVESGDTTSKFGYGAKAKSVAELYGFASNAASDPPVSQITISDSSQPDKAEQCSLVMVEDSVADGFF